MKNIFINYRRAVDQAVAHRLATDLKKVFGRKSVFIDVDGLKPGEHFPTKLDRVLADTAVLLVIMGPGWLDVRDKEDPDQRRLDDLNDFVRLEIARGLSTDGVTVLPVCVDRAVIPEKDQLPDDIRPMAGRHAVELETGHRYAEDLTRLVNAIRAELRKRRRPGVLSFGAVSGVALLAGLAAGPDAHFVAGDPLRRLPAADDAVLRGQLTAAQDAATRARSARDAERTRRTEMEAALGEARERLTATSAQLAAAQKNEAAAQAALTSLRAQSAEQADAIRQLEALASAREDQIAQLGDQLSAAETARDAAEAERRKAQEQLGEIAAELAVARNSQAEAQSAVAAAGSERNAARQAAREAEQALTTQKQRTAEREETLTRLEAEARQAKKQNEELTKELALAEGKLIAQTTEINLLSAALGARKRCDGVVVALASGGTSCITPGSGESFKDCSDCPEMVVVPAGRFMMGSPQSEEGRYSDEGPQRRVTIARPFAVGKFEVTFAEWDACVAAGGCQHRPNDGGWGRGQRPVIHVSWEHITKQYLPWLNRKLGLSGNEGYRLLSEAEWEYAARAGTTTRFHFGNSDRGLAQHAWYLSNANSRTHPVGGKAANAWGLHDVHGNVWEWVEDCHANNYNGAPTDGSARTTVECSSRVLRGGSWFGNPRYLRSAFRFRLGPGNRINYNGFRVARTLNP